MRLARGHGPAFFMLNLCNRSCCDATVGYLYRVMDCTFASVDTLVDKSLKTPAKANMDVEAEILDLKRRMTILENEVRANRDVSVKLFIHIREMRDDIALIRSHAVVTDKRMERLEQRMDRVEADLTALKTEVKELRTDLNGLRSEFNAFRKELPGMIADTMREVLRDYRGR
jgi:chromosome segregation ATPase